MHISRIRIRNFRSIENETIPLDQFTVFCGPNSCGKSNIFRAIQLAFQKDVSKDDAQKNLTASKLGHGGAPLLSIWVECVMADISLAIQEIAGVANSSITYSFRVTRSGSVTRKLGTKVLSKDDFERILENFLPIYVPPIRDLEVDGLTPFKQLIKSALMRARGPESVRGIAETIKSLLDHRISPLVDQRDQVAKRILRAEKIHLDTSRLDVEALYDNIGLLVQIDENSIPLSSLGTGHQSAVIMHLYRRLGESMGGDVLFLFEEPDNHLHPSTIRSICDDLKAMSSTAQVLVSTHSPVLLEHVGFHPLRPLVLNDHRHTVKRNITLFDCYTEKQARAHLDFYGLRLTEPLLCSQVIVVEGITDKIALTTLFEMRTQVTPDHKDLLIINAGGKGRVVTLCHLLHCLKVNWKCVFDHDALFSAEVPYSVPNLSAQNISDNIVAIDSIKRVMDISSKRGRDVIKALNAVRNELMTVRPVRTYLDGSPVKKLIDLTNGLSAAEIAQFRAATRRNRRRESRELLRKANIFTWSATLENAILRNPHCEAIVESKLVALGKLSPLLANDPNRRTAILNKLHDAATQTEIFSQIVGDLESARKFNRTEVNDCFSYLFDDL